MNERIKELAKKSERIWNLYTIGPVQRDEVEQFVELIVQKCIQELETSKKGDIYTGELFNCEWNDCINTQIAMLKEEFGLDS